MIIRKADKANTYVVMDRTEYSEKLHSIISDESKFKQLTRNPISDLKTKVNSLINAANEFCHEKLLKPIVGEYKPGYVYGTIKTHKPGNPLRPIIS